MPQIFNQYSALIFAVPAVIFGVALLLRDRRTPMRLAVSALLVILVLGSYLYLRPGGNEMSAERIEVLLVEPVADRPILLEIYSNYCVGCLRAEPVVDALEAEWGDDVQVVQLNINDESARELAATLDFRFTPTFILYTPSGEEVWRQVGGIDPDVVRAEVERLMASLETA
jgi:thiol-disulfide isomerase/thioredoxin